VGARPGVGITRDPVALARERFALRDYHGTVMLLREAVVDGFAYADAYHLLGLSLAFVDRPDDALAAFDEALRLNPRYVEAHLNRALLLGTLGRDVEAREGLEHAAHLGQPDASGFPAIVGNRLANAHATLGREYRDAGALDEAIAQFRRALELRASFADIRLALARALVERGLHDEAAVELDQVLAKRPEALDALLLRGLCDYLRHDLDGAATAWNRAAEHHPGEPRVEIYRSMLVRRRSAAQ
jgi:tetratricopeptide (TPR) repeat protein